jgi:hypothetical protein
VLGALDLLVQEQGSAEHIVPGAWLRPGVHVQALWVDLLIIPTLLSPPQLPLALTSILREPQDIGTWGCTVTANSGI